LLVALATALAVAAPAAPGRLGSIISSFRLGGLWGYSYCISRDNSYIYVIKDYQQGSGSPLIAFTPGGKFAFSSSVGPNHSEADHSVLGDGYMAAINWYGVSRIYDYSVYTGSVAGSWAPLEKMSAYAFIPGGRYKYVITRDYPYYGYLCRFTTEGSLAGSFSVGPEAGALAATDTLAGRSGEYLIVAKGSLMTVYSASGSVVASYVHFQSPTSNHGCVCGPGYPTEYGTTLWYIQSVWYEYDAYVFQAYLGNGVPVEPTSVGKVKALFR
jgi:hypothetical protein